MKNTIDNPTSEDLVTEVDVLIIGAGLSGVGAAWRIQQQLPDASYLVLEARAEIGGTWDLFRYPGIRSDSDMFTFSYPFRPWPGRNSLAAGREIRSYIRATASDAGITSQIRFGVQVVSAAWSSDQARWTVKGEQDGEQWRCKFLYLCTGYYDYQQPYQPEFAGVAEFRGRFVQPQFWPNDLDYRGVQVVIIGSGATAVTLVPALAKQAAQVTMLQRSPTYLAAIPQHDQLADWLRGVLPAAVAHKLIRRKNVTRDYLSYALARQFPATTKRLLRRGIRQHLDEAYVAQHFTPKYQPWDQRICATPDAELLTAISSGRAAVVTDHLDRFTATGVRLQSGRTLEADVVVSATGLKLLPLGGIELIVDEVSVDVGSTTSYRGLMLSGVPNLAYCLGYTNASWTLRADLSARYLCRLLNHLARFDYDTATPLLPGGVKRRPLLELDSGYVRRAAGMFPAQGDRSPWSAPKNYLCDSLSLQVGRLDDQVLWTRRELR